MIDGLTLNVILSLTSAMSGVAATLKFYDKRIKRNEKEVEQLQTKMQELQTKIEEIKVELAEIKSDVKWIIKYMNGKNS